MSTITVGLELKEWVEIAAVLEYALEKQEHNSWAREYVLRLHNRLARRVNSRAEAARLISPEQIAIREL